MKNVKESAKILLEEMEKIGTMIWMLDNGDPDYPDEDSEETFNRILPELVQQYSKCVARIKMLID